MKIVVLDDFTTTPGDLSWDKIAKCGELTVYDRTGADDAISRIGDAEIVFTNKVVLTKEIIDACPSIRFICETGTGFNNIDVEAAAQRGIPVSNVPSYSTSSVAQMVFAYLLEIAQRASAHSASVHSGAWAASPDFCFCDYPTFELEGKTLGIIGFGAIGQRVAKIAKSFGMNILAYDLMAHPELESEQLRQTSLDELLSKSDIISLHTPQNAASQGMINSDTISKMKNGAILINTARGACIVDADVRTALDSGKLGFFAADVLSQEPPKPDNPLLGAQNCLLTPHIAWMSFEARARLMDILEQNVKAFLTGKPINVVNF